MRPIIQSLALLVGGLFLAAPLPAAAEEEQAEGGFYHVLEIANLGDAANVPEPSQRWPRGPHQMARVALEDEGQAYLAYEVAAPWRDGGGLGEGQIAVHVPARADVVGRLFVPRDGEEAGEWQTAFEIAADDLEPSPTADYHLAVHAYYRRLASEEIPGREWFLARRHAAAQALPDAEREALEEATEAEANRLAPPGRAPGPEARRRRR